jgi:hypothetical protein
MPTEQLLQLLIDERDRLNVAIEALQGTTKRRGRPPKNPLAVPVTAATPEPTKRKTRRFSASQRKKQAERMKAYWAAKKKAEAKSQPIAASKHRKAAVKKAAKKTASAS